MSGQPSPLLQLKVAHNEAASKLDYFILGVTLAICAYLAQTNPYAQLGVNKETFLLGSLLVFAASAICGFKRIESTIAAIRINATILEEPNLQVQAYCLQRLRDSQEPHWWYVIRNYLLGAGLLCYLATKVWDTYQNHGWIQVH
ncbi:hypothetical protein [Pseudomonas chlororaphis]|uniref:hypothetical protein n=1 Tax=Pseudomonas chlororaphis TaxID=587753 RepID=UPI000F55B992|nr:hypothetical protein [Pseudomonas chlororaphis]AZC94219.1 hypothetical protein C4K28_1476 [Pseudomonas chlororaphis subsp. piscium]